MEQKPLIGISICAVVILIITSFSNVVGYQSVKSTAVNDSPLFQKRTQRAINQQQNVLTSRYLGMGKDYKLSFPIRDSNNAILERAIEIISKMDEKTFKQFKELCIQKTRRDSIVKNINPEEISQVIYQLRTQPGTIINSFINGNNNKASSSLITIEPKIPGCEIITIFYAIIFIFLWILYFIYLEIIDFTSHCPHI